MKLLLFFSALIVSLSSLNAQNNAIWYFGDGNFLDFNANLQTPVLSAHGIELATPVSTYCQEGSSTICDASGNLLFYNNSQNVWDKNYTLMPNGTGLIGSASTSAQTLIVPKPGSVTKYYIFHMDYAASSPNNGLFYSEVDMTLNGGDGNVTANKNIALGNGACSEQLKAITHCNGTDIWVISHSVTGNIFRCFLVSAAGVSSVPVSTSIGNNHPSAFSGMSYMTCSKDGGKVALAGNMGGVPSVEVFTFDNLNGTFCNPQYLPSPDIASAYGVEFSADGTKIYTTGYQLHQYNFVTAQWYTYSPSEIGAALMRGPNDKIYIVGGCDYYDAQSNQIYYARNIHVIASPNVTGAGATLQMNAYLTPRECGMGLSTCYYPTQIGSNCTPLDASFTINNTQICEGDCINYTNNSSGAAIDSYQWAFQGGSPATFTGSAPPSICYSSQGIYQTELQITDCYGSTSTYLLDIEVIDCTLPQPDFQANQTQFCINSCIDFLDLSTGTNINNWSWSFPGGTPNSSTAQYPTNICYANSGSYDVTLTVTDDLGTNSVTYPNYITVDACIPPVANFSAPDTVCVGSCITFNDLSINTPTQWNWTLNGAVQSTATVQNPQNVCFNTTGTFLIELTASNSYGSSNYSKEILVLALPDAGADVSLSWCETETPMDLELLLPIGVLTTGSWINSQNTPAFSGTVFSPGIAGAGVYTIQYVLMNYMCSDTMEFNIEVQHQPNAGVNGFLAICDNDSPIDLMTVLQGNPDLNGNWSPPLISGNSMLDPATDAPGVYTYTVPQTQMCSFDTSKATVTISYVFDISISPVADLCSNSPEILLVANMENGQWSGNGISDFSSGLFNPTLAGSGTHIIMYSIEIDDCSASATTEIEIADPPYVDLGQDLIQCTSETLMVEIDTPPTNQVTWWNGISGSSVLVDFSNYNAGETISIGVEVENSCGISSDELVKGCFFATS